MNILFTDYVGPTDTKPSRIKLHSLRHNSTKFISYGYSNGLTYEQAEMYLTDIGFSIVGTAENGNGYIIIVNEFENIK